LKIDPQFAGVLLSLKGSRRYRGKSTIDLWLGDCEEARLQEQRLVIVSNCLLKTFTRD
jgi:hypothetical protein